MLSRSAGWESTGIDCYYGCCNTVGGQLSRKVLFRCPRSRLRIWSREAGSVLPSRASPLIRRTQAEYGAYSRTHLCSAASRTLLFSAASRTGIHLLYRQPPSGHYRTCRVMQLNTYGVYRRETAGIWPAVVKVALVTGAAFSENQFNPPIVHAGVLGHANKSLPTTPYVGSPI